MRFRVAVIALLSLGASPAGATAASSVSSDGSTVQFRSGASPADMVFTQLPEGGFSIVNAAAPLAVGPGCALGVPVTCTGLTTVEARLSSGDDRAKGPSVGANDLIWGGAGNDEIFAGGTHNAVWAGSGDDVVVGGSSAQSDFRGQAGDDRLAAGGVNARLDGGPGRDILDSTGQLTSLTGGPGRDILTATIRSFSLGGTISGGDGDDVIAVSSFGPVRDAEPFTLQGGSGDDTILGSPVADTIYGGPGSDEISVQGDGVADTVSCGGGWDRVHVDPEDIVSSDCEAVVSWPIDTTGDVGAKLAAAAAFRSARAAMNTDAPGPLFTAP